MDQQRFIAFSIGATKMIDIAIEAVIPIAEAPQHIPGRPSLATVWRGVLNGTRAGKLESVLIGGRRFTSLESIQRFAKQSTAAADADTPPARTPRQLERAMQQAERELERDGI
jgi:hypothetical protein